MRTDRIRKVAGTAAATAAGKSRPARSAPEPPAAPAADPPKPPDLDNPDTQGRILAPEPAEVTIGGVPVLLHPMPAKLQRQFLGFYGRVMGASTSPGLRQSIIAPDARLSLVMLDDAELSSRFALFVARATFPTADPPAQDVLTKEQARIDDVIQPGEYASLMMRMVDLNGTFAEFLKVVRPPEGEPDPTKPTT